jgi:hypothetical protein
MTVVPPARLRDDAARHRDAHRLDLIVEQLMLGEPPPLAAGIAIVVDLEETVRCGADLDDRGERVDEKRLESACSPRRVSWR